MTWIKPQNPTKRTSYPNQEIQTQGWGLIRKSILTLSLNLIQTTNPKSVEGSP